MGYWFENMEKMDIQAERRNTAEARAELKKTKRELEKSQKDAEKAQKELEKVQRDAEKAQKEFEKVHKDARENEIIAIVTICRKHGVSKEQAVEDIVESCHLERKTVEEKIALYWKEQL